MKKKDWKKTGWVMEIAMKTKKILNQGLKATKKCRIFLNRPI